MKKIEGELSTHYQKDVSFPQGNFMDNSFRIGTKKEWNRFGATVSSVRASEGYKISNFRELIDEVAIVTLNNKSFEMFYRGQKNDYLNNQGVFYKDRKQKSTILPAICRPDKKSDGTIKYSIRQKNVSERYEYLYSLIDYINKQKRSRLPYEYYMSLFQHYEIARTPLIDITQSLRVASTFALDNSEIGFLYVFGLPFPNQSISYYTDLGIILLKLQNVVSVNAVRPRYQEGYLVGKFPFSNKKTVSDDLSNRMVAKFKLDNSNGDFWDKDFQPMPNEVLFPKNDIVEQELKAYKEKFDEKYYS